MKGDRQVVLAILVVLFGFMAGFLSKDNGLGVYVDGILGALVTLVAAFFGAWYAFRLHDDKDGRKRADSDVRAANRAIFEISRHCNRLATFRKQFLDEHKHNPNRDYLIMPVSGFSWDAPSIDYDALAFLIESSQPELLTEVAVMEQSISSAVDVIRQRSEFHVEKLQPVVEKLEYEYGPEFLADLIEQRLGPKNARVLQLLTDYNYECVDTAISEMEKIMDRLAKAVKNIYPQHVVVSFKVPATQ